MPREHNKRIAVATAGLKSRQQAIETALGKVAETLAKDVLDLASIGGMPDTFWLTDHRIGRACRQLGWSRREARTWAQARRR